MQSSVNDGDAFQFSSAQSAADSRSNILGAVICLGGVGVIMYGLRG